MVPEEEKAHQKNVRRENEERKDMSIRASPKKLSWLNSRISLLLIGSLLTGILVPWFQISYRAIEWRRQNQFENVSFRLSMMRDCLTQFVYLSACTAEGYELVERFMDTAALTHKDYEEFEQQCIDLQSRRFTQNAKVRSLTIYFRDGGRVKDLVLTYVHNCNRYFDMLRTFIRTKYAISNPTNGEQTDLNEEDLDELRNKIDSYMTTLNNSYKAVIAKMREDIGEVEDESEEFRL